VVAREHVASVVPPRERVVGGKDRAAGNAEDDLDARRLDRAKRLDRSSACFLPGKLGVGRSQREAARARGRRGRESKVGGHHRPRDDRAEIVARALRSPSLGPLRRRRVSSELGIRYAMTAGVGDAVWARDRYARCARRAGPRNRPSVCEACRDSTAVRESSGDRQTPSNVPA